MKNLLFIFFLLLFSQSKCQTQDVFYDMLADSAMTLTADDVTYDPTYRTIPYPNGDVAPDKGVCTDVVIRAYRKMGIDLQKEVHEDMVARFDEYPQKWGLKKPNTSIDHRRVPNLMTFFTKHGTVKKITNDPLDYQPGDIVCWNLRGGITHIGIVVKYKTEGETRHWIVHNIGRGQILEDCLFRYKIIGHYSYKK